uniref:Uncharacterized protein n=1 Tax=Opuntia streptacantha TaxID=393608 RepID=A0A7C9E5F5_OPUST
MPNRDLSRERNYVKSCITPYWNSKGISVFSVEYGLYYRMKVLMEILKSSHFQRLQRLWDEVLTCCKMDKNTPLCLTRYLCLMHLKRMYLWRSHNWFRVHLMVIRSVFLLMVKLARVKHLP